MPDLPSFAAMAARATRSASRKARVAEAVATGPLGALSHDELGVIFDGLADPLRPVVAVALSSTCLGLRTPLREAVAVLKERHVRAVALCRKVGLSRAGLRDAAELMWVEKEFNTGDMATLGMLLCTNGLPSLESLELALSLEDIGDKGVQALFDGLGHCAAPSLRLLGFGGNEIGPPGAAALAAALHRGAMPKLAILGLQSNPIGSQGVAALAPVLRKMPALKKLCLCHCDIGDEGVASLVGNLGKDDFKALENLYLDDNKITSAGGETLAAAVNGNAFQLLEALDIRRNDMSAEEEEALKAKLDRVYTLVGDEYDEYDEYDE